MLYMYCPKCDNEYDEIEVEDTLDQRVANCPDCDRIIYPAGSIHDPRVVED